jgi:hypothetical protein
VGYGQFPVLVIAVLVTFVLTCVLGLQLHRFGARYQDVHELRHNPSWTVSGVGLWRPMLQRHHDPELVRLQRESAVLFITWLTSAAVAMSALPCWC